MRKRTHLVLLLGLLACAGCQKSTDELVKDSKSPQGGDRVKAVRLLTQRAQRKEDAVKVVPALIDALQDKESDDARWSAAIGLGYFGEQAKDAIPALQEAQHDPDARVREAAGVALSRIDPATFPAPSKPRGQ
jgi:HEAT repeat protein